MTTKRERRSHTTASTAALLRRVLLVTGAGVCAAWSPRALAGVTAARAPGQGSEARIETVDPLGLTLTFPPVFAQVQRMRPDDPSSPRKAAWNAQVGGKAIRIEVYGMPRVEYGYLEPEDVTENVRAHLAPVFEFEATESVEGKFGLTPRASLGWGALREDGESRSFFVLGGLEESHGYAVEVIGASVLTGTDAEVVLEFLRKGVACSTPPLDPRWSDAEIEARWRKDAPADLAKKLEKPVRTKHYVFLSNTSAARQMGAHMEEFYATIQELYPFPEVEGRRLMPVFLFRNPEEYHEFLVKNLGGSLEDAQKSKGVAYRDFYATYYDAPQDPVHIHEATHQIFANRLRLGGGGSWLQEGVAEYASTRPSDRTDASNLVKKGRHQALGDFMRVESLLWSDPEADRKGDGAARGSYAQAALLIEFVKESKWSKAKFQDWLHAVGKCPSNDVAAIEQATQRTLGVDLAGLEEKWIEYCDDR
jgi:hypothetical protein